MIFLHTKISCAAFPGFSICVADVPRSLANHADKPIGGAVRFARGRAGGGLVGLQFGEDAGSKHVMDDVWSSTMAMETGPSPSGYRPPPPRFDNFCWTL